MHPKIRKCSPVCRRQIADLFTKWLSSVEELYKIADIHPETQCVLRLAVDDTDASFAFSEKFGATLTDVPLILREARTLGLSVTGVSFHVGSGNTGTDAHSNGVAQAYEAFEIGRDMGFDINLIDLGGGWPGHADSDRLFGEMAKNVQMEIKKFPDHVKFIAEPVIRALHCHPCIHLSKYPFNQLGSFLLRKLHVSRHASPLARPNPRAK